MYIAPAATHSPHQVDKEWIDKYKGKFDGGWDVYREQVLARQKKMGIIPADAKLPPYDPRVPHWNSLNATQKKVYERFMEAYAGFFEYTDEEVGRLLDHLREKGLEENTVVIAIIGDNGASPEGGYTGMVKPELLKMQTQDYKTKIESLAADIDKIGRAGSFTSYPTGWVQATTTPYRHWKGDANSEGATRNPMIVYWPGHVSKGIRTQYGHVIDMLPTTLEIAGVHAPQEVRGIPQDPIQGTSLTYAFGDANAPSRHTKQYYYMFGSGAIVENGWKASFYYRPEYVDIFTTYPPPKEIQNNAGKEVWELYNLNTDFNERVDLAARSPGKLKELQGVFRDEMTKNHGYPLINWSDVYSKLQKFSASGKRHPDVSPTLNR